MKKAIFASALASLLIAGSAFAAAGYTFSNYLRVGSTGADVVALQSFLVDGGFLSMPAGVSMGYFGQLTKAAVVKYQASVSLPATGFVGPLTVAKLNGTTVVTLPPAACPAGYTCTPVGGTTPGTTTGGITTPGVEGTLTVTSSNAGLPSTLYEGDSMVGVLGLKVEAKTSDIAIQRVKIDLGTSSKVYNKIFRKIYITEGSTVLASADLNSSTVVKESDNQYTITLAGFSTVVARNSSKILTVKMDLYSSIDSTDYDNETYPVRLYGTTGAVRGVDGAGIDQYSGTNSITRTPTLSGSLIDSATLKLSTTSDTPKSYDLIASAGANKDEADKVTTLIFDLKAEKDAVLVTDIIATTTGTAVTDSSITTAYLYVGSTEIDSASVGTNGIATFNDVDISIAKDERKTLSIKVDVRSASTTALTASTTIAAAGISAENSAGDTITAGSALTGSASGNTITIKKTGITISLVSKSAVPTRTTNSQTATSTAVLDAVFTLRVTANGADVILGQVGSTTGAFAKADGTIANTAASFTIYKNGTDLATTTLTAANSGSTAVGSDRYMVVSYDTPDTGVTVDNTNASFTIADGNSADIVVHAKATLTGSASSNSYAVQLKKLYINGVTTVTFMDGQSAWRTDGVVLP